MDVRTDYDSAIEIYREWLVEGRDAVDLLNTVDKKLFDLAHHLAIAHRNLAENRAELHSLFAWRGERNRQNIARSSEAIEALLSVRDELFDLRFHVLKRIETLGQLQRVTAAAY
ncbi:hypothetical protein [Luteimonas sp. YGD11-2]|uniref:hypothetical protein n=1 Tax=Luteimonas sp. YGD11-2 TaxID=2508168 RepID=UPI00100AF3FE|nr:hypothetical protein [Luteimonas sp. YGD11-2]